MDELNRLLGTNARGQVTAGLLQLPQGMAWLTMAVKEKKSSLEPTIKNLAPVIGTFALSYAVVSVVQPLAIVSKCCGLAYCVCCACAKGLGITMMKAPGAGGLLIPRALFQISPRLYFGGLRTAQSLAGLCSSSPGLVACYRGVVAWAGVKFLSGIARPARR